MDDFIPLNESELERSIGLKSWLESWTDKDLEFLHPKDCFLKCIGKKHWSQVLVRILD